MTHCRTDQSFEKASGFAEAGNSDHQARGERRETPADRDIFGLPNWEHPGKRELDQVKDRICSTLLNLPYTWEISGGSYRGRSERLERLVPCSEVVLKTDWESPYFTPVAVEVFNTEGESLGNLEIGGGISLSAVACLVPFLRAYAYEVEPRSILPARARHPRMRVLVEIASLSLDEVLNQVDEIFSLPTCERSRRSVVDEGGR